MRRGEILGLKWDNLGLKHGFILLDKTKNGERREITIHETLRLTLKSLERRLDTPYVFFNPETALPYGDTKTAFKAACRRAGIKDFHFHDLRHTFASHLVMAGVDITTTQRYCWVSNLKVQRDYYKAIEVVLQRTQCGAEYDDETGKKVKKESRV